MLRHSNLPARGIALVRLLLLMVLLIILVAIAYLFLGDRLLTPLAETPSQSPASGEQSPLPDLSRLAEVVASISGSQTQPLPGSAPTELRPEQIATLVTTPLNLTPDQALPDLDNSDSLFRSSLARLDPTQMLISSLINEEMIRKLVVTIDNMAEGRVPRKHSLILPMSDRFRASEKGDEVWLDGYNYSRYSAYVELLTSIDTQQWAEFYQRYYPQMQQAYAELGYPRKAFHERVLQALEHLLQSPVLNRPLPLAQPSVMYTFAEPELEQMSAVHKQMLRLGPVNSRRVLDAMRVLRAKLIRLEHKSS